MENWKVGQKLICDRRSQEAYITELRQTDWGIYATLHNPQQGFTLCSSLEMLQEQGWQASHPDEVLSELF